MKYALLSFVFAWLLPTKNDRQRFRVLCKMADARKRCAILRKKYEKLTKKLKKKQKCKVVFLINDKSKWKCQSLFDLMSKDPFFDPVIALTIADMQKKLPQIEKEKILNDNRDFFQQQQIDPILAFDVKKNRALNLKKIGADIVFYQQPYSLPKFQDIHRVSKFALTCYVPYYLPDYKNFELDCDQLFHHHLFRFYVLNDELKNIYKEHQIKQCFDGENIKPVGHTMLDNIKMSFSSETKTQTVIYAPHWSISREGNENDTNISTFDTTGNIILDYAQQHPEINWIFKPHPVLKTALLRTGQSESSIENYYNAWEKFATCCYDSNYIELFNRSTAMITDCGSFLLEYFCTGKPLIHLISQHCEHDPYQQTQEIFDTFYKVTKISDLTKTLDNLLISQNDFKQSYRLEVLNKLNFIKDNAAENIVNDLKNAINGNIN